MVIVGRTREERIYNPAKEYFSKEKEKPVYEETGYYDTVFRTCTLTKNKCCAPLPKDSLRPDGKHDCRKCNVPMLCSLKEIRNGLEDLMKVYYDIVARMEEEK